MTSPIPESVERAKTVEAIKLLGLDPSRTVYIGMTPDKIYVNAMVFGSDGQPRIETGNIVYKVWSMEVVDGPQAEGQEDEAEEVVAPQVG
jgi:hypothetical protein